MIPWFSYGVCLRSDDKRREVAGTPWRAVEVPKIQHWRVNHKIHVDNFPHAIRTLFFTS